MWQGWIEFEKGINLDLGKTLYSTIQIKSVASVDK